MQPTAEQQAIIAEGRTGKGNILIEALAGCAKTTTLIEVIKAVPQRSILFAAFNRGIAQEAESRIPRIEGKAIVVQTLHALGRSIVMKHFPRCTVDKTATEALVGSVIDRRFKGAPFDVRWAAVRLVRCAKETLSPARGERGPDGAWLGWPLEDLLHLGFDQRLFSPKLSSLQIDRAVGIAHEAIAVGTQIEQRSAIDFCDMVWLPLVRRLAPPSRYQAIMLDEVQDVSAPQVELLETLALQQTRWIVAGDSWQQIYSWRGSLGAEVWKRFEKPGSKRFPLTMTWRCSLAVVRAVNDLIPALKARPDADEGSETTITLGELPFKLARGPSEDVHTFVLSRTNAALLECALFLWRSGAKFKLNASKELLDPLFHLIEQELDLQSDVSFRKSLFAWHKREVERADKLGSTSRREQVDEQRMTLLAALRYAEPKRLRALLLGLTDERAGVLLSSVHKVKGLEAERVFLLRQTFARHAIKDRRLALDVAFSPEELEEIADDLPDQEELNIEIVAITRTKQHLTWVNLAERGRPELLTIAVDEIPEAELDAAWTLTERELLQAVEQGDHESMADLEDRLEQITRRIMRGGR